MSRLTTLKKGWDDYKDDPEYFPGPRTALVHFIFKGTYLASIFPYETRNTIADTFEHLGVYLENICPD